PGSLPADLYQRMDQAAALAPPGSDGVLFLPYFNGSLAPSEDQWMRGAFLNLSHRTTREHLTRAVLEGISFGWRWLIECAEKMLGQRFGYLRLGGGGALSDVWAQVFADVTGKPIHQLADPRNGNVLGAALLAFHRLGWMDIEDIPGKVSFNRVYQPNPENHNLYSRLFPLFLASRKNNKAVFHALNKA
ncbi:MAG: xylulose kinase, partial [Chloroflexi bacterium]|nr:xylulose kinase [Chloroflexota bacterium]